jgi:ribonuclease P protein component
VLPKNARLTISADFARATKSGTRVTTENLVGYLYISPVTNQDHPKCGLIINKSVGGSVLRHTLARKLRHCVAPLISQLPTGSLLVIRALAKESKSSTNFATEVEALITRLVEKSQKSTVKR